MTIEDTKYEGGIRFKANRWKEVNPLVSIITVVSNGVNEIENTIQSVISQKESIFEYIIVDGGSSDGTVDVIQKYEDYIDYWISEPDMGIYDAMNKGVELTTGEWVIFMNCGDEFISNDVLSIFEAPWEADIIYGDAVVLYPSFESIFVKVPVHQMWKRMPFCHQACFVKTTLMRKLKFDLTFKLSSDYNFLYKAYLAGYKFEFINKKICYFNYVGDGSSQKNALLSLKERKKIVLKNYPSLFKSVYYLKEEIYLYVSTFFKNMIGKNLAEWINQRLKK